MSRELVEQLPADSILHHWITRFDNTELWWSWRIATGLAMVGAVLGRKVYYPGGETRPVYPNTSVILIGPSGTGKDTINQPAATLLEDVGVSYVAGKTIEAIKLSLVKLGDPAVGYIVAGELKEFLGDKDYQAGIIQSLTDILSNNDKIDTSTKGDLTAGSEAIIYHPTLTMFGGSTPEWLHSIRDAMSGGFLPRFLIVAEMGDKRKAGLTPIWNSAKFDTTEKRDAVAEAKVEFARLLREVRMEFVRRPKETCIDNTAEGENFVANWYENRYGFFPPTMHSYAERSGGLMKRVALLTAVSRRHTWIDVEDYEFAAKFIQYIATRMEEVVIDVPREVEVAREILKILPGTWAHILRVLGGKYEGIWLKRAVSYLTESGIVDASSNTMVVNQSKEIKVGTNTTEETIDEEWLT